MTDAGESGFKDVRQNLDGSITIHGNKDFWCAFGHPYRQIAFQEKYKWDIIKQNTANKIDTGKIPLKPLIRMFLVDANTVKDIMLRATTEDFNVVAGDRPYNVDARATNQFGLDDYSKRKLEMAALPGSLVTHADFDQLSEFDKYSETTKTWGEIRKVAELKEKLNLPTEVFTPPKSSFFITTEKNYDAKLANDEAVANMLRKEKMITGKEVDPRWQQYASLLEKMNSQPKPTDAYQLNMINLQTRPINEYKLDFTDNTVKNYIIKQQLNTQQLTDAKRLSDSLEITKIATKKPGLRWDSIASKATGYNQMTKAVIRECANFIAGIQDPDGMVVLGKEMRKKEIPWKYSPSLDSYKENLKSAVDALKREGLLAGFPSGEQFTKAELMNYYKKSLKEFILSSNIDTDKNIILQNIDRTSSKKNIIFTTDENAKSKIVLRADMPERQICMPGDELSIEFKKDVSVDQIKKHLSNVFDNTVYSSPPEKVNLLFPDSDLDQKTASLWKKRAIEVGDYLKSSMKVQNIEMVFRETGSLKYDMISHTIDLGQGKEMPVRLVNGHLILGDHIAPPDAVKKIQKIYDGSGEGNRFRNLLESKKSDILFVQNTDGFFLSNKGQKHVSNSPMLADYENKQFKKPIRNEIIIALDEGIDQNIQNQKQGLSATDEAANMLYDGAFRKNRDNIILMSASKKNSRWNVNMKLSPKTIGAYDNVRITVVGKGVVSTTGALEIGGQNSKGINDLIQEVKTSLNIKDDGVQQISIVGCNPDTSKAKNSANRAIKLGQDIAKQNKVAVSTRIGYVKVDEEGHKWFSATENGDYHRRQEGDVYIAEWDGKKVISGTSKVQVKALEFLKDSDIIKSGHLGVSNTVSNELESEIFRSGVLLQEEMKSKILSDKISSEISQSKTKTIFDNPKVQKRLQKLGNVMSKYGMLQTATFLVNAEKCKETNYTSKEACQARKAVAIISLSQEATELVAERVSKASKSLSRKPPKVKTLPKPGASSLKAFGKSFMRNPLKGLPLLGVGLDAVSLGLDIYDLVRAKNTTEKAIAGTNVALSGLSFIAGATALGASLLGFTAIAAVAGPAALVVGALSFLFNIGVSIWQAIELERQRIEFETSQVRETAKYFETMHSVYDQRWYDCKESTFYFRPRIAAKSLSLRHNHMEAYSEYLCETKRQDWKRHIKLYWPVPLICDDYDSLESNCYCYDLNCSGLINVRSGMNIGGTQYLDCSDINIVYLNTTPIVLNEYTYAYFDKKDRFIGLFSQETESKFQDSGHNLARMIDHNNPNFDYDYHFCFDKYAIINNMGFKRFIPSTTMLELGTDHVNVVIPAYEKIQKLTSPFDLLTPVFGTHDSHTVFKMDINPYEDTLPVNFVLLGLPGATYSVYLSNSCNVTLQTNPDSYSFGRNDLTLWKLVIDIELVDIGVASYSQTYWSFNNTEVHIDDTEQNRILFKDKHNILSMPLKIDHIWYTFIAEIDAKTFSSDKNLLNIIDRYLTNDFIELSLTYTPVRNLRINQCGNDRVSKVYVSRGEDHSHLHFTSEFPGSCSGKLNTDAKLHFNMNDRDYYSSASYSLVWQTHFTNNSLKSLVKLPCHSEIHNNISFSVIEDRVYIIQKLNLSQTIEVEITHVLTDSRMYLLTILTEQMVSWETINALCFMYRTSIFSEQEHFRIKRNMILSGENDLTFVNTSSSLYWVRKKDGVIVERIVPNIGTTCSSIEISFPALTGDIEIIQEKQCGSNNSIHTMNGTQIYYFLCTNGLKNKTFVQVGDNTAKEIENLDNKQVYFDGNDILVKNETNIYSYEDGSPSGVCLYEYEIHLPYKQAESMESVMIEISQEYECVESKVKLRFRQLVGWFDYEEMMAIIVHKSISSYKLNAVGAATEHSKYWIFDAVNGSLYIQEIAEPMILYRLIIGNISESEYQAMVPIPNLVITKVQQVSYENGRVFAYTSDGATYHFHANGKAEILAVTDHWFEQHPDARDDLQKNTNKEIVLYRPDIQKEQTNTRCKRSTTDEQPQFDNFFLYHIEYGIVFKADVQDSVFIGSNQYNTSIFMYDFNNKTLLEIDRYGDVIGQNRYNLIHRINDKTLIVEASKYTESSLPPLIDNAKTIILSAPETDFTFKLSELCWSHFEEILLSDDATSSRIVVDLEMVPCDYSVEKFDDRVLLIDFAHLKKLIIPNAEERSIDGLIELYVCGERIVLHDTNYLIYVIAGVISLVIITIATSLIFVWRRRRQGKTAEPFIPNERELQSITQNTVQPSHTEGAKKITSVVEELKKTSKFERKYKKSVKVEHRILKRGGEDTIL